MGGGAAREERGKKGENRGKKRGNPGGRDRGAMKGGGRSGGREGCAQEGEREGVTYRSSRINAPLRRRSRGEEKEEEEAEGGVGVAGRRPVAAGAGRSGTAYFSTNGRRWAVA